MELTLRFGTRTVVLTPRKSSRANFNRNIFRVGENSVTNSVYEWQVYRSKHLYRAKRLTAPLVFVDALGHEQRGKRGDYLVESSSGLQRIWPRRLFEDAHVPLDAAEYVHPAVKNGDKNESSKTRMDVSEWSNPLSGIKAAKGLRKRPASCGKAAVPARIPAVNCLRYNM